MAKVRQCLPFLAVLLLPLLFYPSIHGSGWRSSSDVHALLEFAASLLAITAAAMVLLHFFSTGRRFFLIISIGLVLIGAEEFVHAVFSFDRMWPETHPTYRLAVSTTWLTGHFVLLGSLFVALLLGEGEVVPARRGVDAVVCSTIGVLCAVGVALLIFVSPLVPGFVQLGSPTKIIIELSLALLFFVAFLFYLDLYIKQPFRSPLLWSLVAFIALRVVAHVFVFDSRAFYDAQWDVAHVIVFLSYFLPIFGVWGETIAMHKAAQLRVVELRQEIAARKKADEEVAFKNSLLSAQQEASIDGILAVDANDKIVLFNRRFVEMWNIPSKLIQSRDDPPVLQWVQRQVADADAFLERVRYLVEHPNKTSRDELVLLDGRVFDRYSAPMLGTSERYYGRVWYFRDVTDCRQAEGQNRHLLGLVAEEKDRLSALVNSIPDEIWFADTKGKFTLTNPPAKREFKLDVTGAAGAVDVKQFMSGLAILNPDGTSRPIDEAPPLRALRGEVVRDQEELVRTPAAGELRHRQVSSSPVKDSQGNVIGSVSVVRDITDHKRTLEELRIAKASAEAASRAKSEFLANMSHEIRTPMTAILGYADIMLNENVGRATRENAAIIKRNGEHLLKVIGDILDLSKIEAGKVQIERTRYSPVRLAAEVASATRPQAAAKQLTLRTDLAGSLPETVLTDPLRLRQVLVNLVGNAIKFTDQGEVCLAVRTSVEGGRPRLCFDVIDTGIGMSEEQLGKLFQPFSQVDVSSTRRFGGAGLGLCISKHLAVALGGDIGVCSKPGEGSVFTVTVDPGPADELHFVEVTRESTVQQSQTAWPADTDAIALHGRVLLAEDGPDNRRLITRVLTHAGAEVTAVENGQLAVESALAARDAGRPFDVILMDMQMPVLDGYDAARELRRQGYTGPIVALTAHAMAEDSGRCRNAGCNDYLSKPFQSQALLAVVAKNVSVLKEGNDTSLAPDDAPLAAADSRMHDELRSS
jgi:signal transduction histidine kinase/CheY-like chemotaxis protein